MTIKGHHNYLFHLKGVRGFSLTEIMITSTIAACLITGVSLIMNVIGSNLENQNTIVTKVNIGKIASKVYYDINSHTVNTYNAPSYGRTATADRLKSKFMDDIEGCTAVFCLARDGHNTIKPAYIPLDAKLDARVLDSPESFRIHLSKVMTHSQNVFKTWRGVSQFSNGSIFILSSSGFNGFIGVRSIYDIDFNQTAEPKGTYASVKRYSWNQLTDYYDIFYSDDSANESFRSLFAFHEKRIRRVFNEGNADSFKTAMEMPFYFIWWPDPSLKLTKEEMTTHGNHIGYGDLAQRTNYFFTVPIFPSL